MVNSDSLPDSIMWWSSGKGDNEPGMLLCGRRTVICINFVEDSFSITFHNLWPLLIPILIINSKDIGICLFYRIFSRDLLIIAKREQFTCQLGEWFYKWWDVCERENHDTIFKNLLEVYLITNNKSIITKRILTIHSWVKKKAVYKTICSKIPI